MVMNIFFVVYVAVAVSGQFYEPEYRLDSEPIPIRRRNDAQYVIQPSIGQEIKYNTDNLRVSNQERRHIENNHRHNMPNPPNTRNFNHQEINPYQTDDRNYDRRPTNERTNNNDRQQDYKGNHFEGRLPEQNHEIHGRHDGNRKNENNNLNYAHHAGSPLKTNLNNPHQRKTHNEPTGLTNHDVKIIENTGNQQNNKVYEGNNQFESQANTNNRNVDISSQNLDNQQNGASVDNVRINENPNQQNNTTVTQNNRPNGDSDHQNNRHSGASLRKIDGIGYGQQNIDSTNNNRNYNTKPNRQNSETTRDNVNTNYETHSQTTESSTRITIDYKSVTGGTKSTEDNELTSKSHPEGRMGNNDDDKWIWSNGAAKTTKTTVTPTIVTVDDRAAFTGDKCPTGQVRFNGMCVDKD